MRTMRVHSTASVSAAARGMSLVELMVGVAIGLIGLLVIFKTVAIWDSHTRTTTSGGDADTAGTLALFNL
jgi:type IV pilus assembly protein PilW